MQRFTVITGTIFEGSNIDLQKWFLAYYMLTNTSKGIASTQLAKQLGITQKTAWFMLHRLRQLAKQDFQIFKGTVEVDETFIDGKEKNKHASKKKGALTPKAPIIGIIERDTKKIKASHVQNTKAMTLKGYIYDNVAFGSSIMTDDNMVYRKINPCYDHKSVSHSMKEYVNGTCHTNNIESFWSMFKRNYIGTYHYMSKKHLQKYINEYVFRYNYKKSNSFDFMARLCEQPKMSYKELING